MTVSTDQFIEEKMRGKSPQERADALIEFTSVLAFLSGLLAPSPVKK
jgi:hypothetical protein